MKGHGLAFREYGLHRIECRIGGAKPLYQHLLTGSSWLWVDAGIATTPADYLFPYADSIQEAGAPVRHMAVVTHADVDHHGGLRALQDRYPWLIALAHGRDVRWITDFPALLRERYQIHSRDGMLLTEERIEQLHHRNGAVARIDMVLTEGEELDLGSAGRWNVLHAPGHSPGHIILWEQRRRWAIVADAALGRGIPDLQGKIVSPPPYYDLRAYRTTIRRLLTLQPERLFPAHFPVMEGSEAIGFLGESLSAVKEIGSALERVLVASRSGQALSHLCQEVSARLGRWPESAWGALGDPLSAHLADLSRRGRIQIISRGGERTYRLEG